MVSSKFVKKPVVIEAKRISEPEILINTREGTVKGYRGDWLITGVEGEIYPCGDAIFRKTYEPVGDGKCRYCEHNTNKYRLCDAYEHCVFQWKEDDADN